MSKLRQVNNRATLNRGWGELFVVHDLEGYAEEAVLVLDSTEHCAGDFLCLRRVILSNIAGSEESAMTPLKKAAHVAGVWYLMFALGPFYLLYIPSKTIVRNDAAATSA